MNIFALSRNARRAARYHGNKHVVKMILESAQLLCTAHRALDGSEAVGGAPLYKLTHRNHPCAVWARASSGNYEWLYELFCALCEEYTFRYGRTHACWTKLGRALAEPPKHIPEGAMTEFALAMPEAFRRGDAVESYRLYYREAKRELCEWKGREAPEWFSIA